MKPLVIALSEGGCAGREGGGDLNNVQCKATQNSYNESPLCNEYILVKMAINLYFLI
jgi:hypothetical protein